MSRTMLKDKIKQGPSVSRVAELLAISRPTFYRQMENYMNMEDSKVSPHVKEYFDKVMLGEFDTDIEALRYLEQSKEMIDMEKEHHAKIISDAQNDLFNQYRYLQMTRENLSVEQRVEREKELDDKKNEIIELAKSFGLDLDEDTFFEADEEQLVWNSGEIRTTCKNFIENVYVIVDLPYERCKDVTVEFFMTISNEDFSIKRVKIPENCRYASMGDVPDGVHCKYSVSWQDENKIKTVGPFPVGKTGY